MAHFIYTVMDETGRRQSGTIVAGSYQTAAKVLGSGKQVVLRLEPIRNWLPALLRRAGLGMCRVPSEVLITFTQQLAAMLRAGMSIKKSLDVILSECSNPVMRGILVDFSTGLDAGDNMTTLFSRHPDVFSAEYVAMITAGESSGNLPLVLERLVGELKHSYQLKKKVSSSFYYPAFVGTFALIIVAAIVVFGVPRFQSIYDGMGATLPLPTRVLLGLSRLAQMLWLPSLALLVAGGCLFRRFVGTPRGRYFWDSVRLSAPLFGPLFQRLAIARFARTLNVLYAAGIPVTQALELVAKSMGNAVMQRVVETSKEEVLEGQFIAEPLRQSGWFTEMSVSMIAAGEQSGTLDSMLIEVAAYYEEQVETTIKGLVSLIEPAIMVVVGAAVGGIVLALALPIFQLATLIAP